MLVLSVNSITSPIRKQEGGSLFPHFRVRKLKLYDEVYLMEAKLGPEARSSDTWSLRGCWNVRGWLG